MDKRCYELQMDMEDLCYRLGNVNAAIDLWQDCVAEELESASCGKELAAYAAVKMRSSYLPSFAVIAESLRSIHAGLQAKLYETPEPQH